MPYLAWLCRYADNCLRFPEDNKDIQSEYQRETLEPEEKENYGCALRHEQITFVGRWKFGDDFKNSSSAALDKKLEENSNHVKKEMSDPRPSLKDGVIGNDP